MSSPFTSIILGVYGGGEVAVVVPDSAGIEYSAGNMQPHFDASHHCNKQNLQPVR